MNLLQITDVALTTAIDSTAQVAADTAQMNYWEMAKKGGPWIMIPLLILSIMAVYIFIERYVAIKKASKEDYEVLYITGKNSYSEFKDVEFPKNVFVEPYIDGLSGLMKDMDLIVSRAGASSLAEITALRIPSILIPSPYVANNHQYYNALSISDEKAGIMIQESELTKDSLKKAVDSILNDEELSNSMRNNLKNVSVDNSQSIIYDELKKLIG